MRITLNAKLIGLGIGLLAGLLFVFLGWVSGDTLTGAQQLYVPIFLGLR